MTTGTIMIFLAPTGQVIAHAADFQQSAPGGYTLADAQALRCKRQLSVAVFEAFANPMLAAAADEYVRATVLRELERTGYRTHTISVEVPLP